MSGRTFFCGLLTILACVLLLAGCEWIFTRLPAEHEPTFGYESFDFDRVFTRYPHLRGVVLSAPEYMEELEMLKATGQLEEAIPEFTLISGVRISIEVIDEPMLTRTVIVGPDGKIDFPYVGEIDAAGKTMREFKALVIERLRRIIKEPQVIMNVTDPSGIYPGAYQTYVGRVNVLGQVGGQGPILIRGGERIDDIIAAAGGMTADAEWRQIHVMKKAKDIYRSRVVIVDWMALMKEKDFRQLIPIHHGDIVFVPLHFSWGQKFEKDWDLILKYLTGAVGYDSSIEALKE